MSRGDSTGVPGGSLMSWDVHHTWGATRRHTKRINAHETDEDLKQFTLVPHTT